MKIALIGYGKMGKAIETLAVAKGHQISARIGRNDDITQIKNSDVAIEFSSPESALHNIKAAIDLKTPLVVGTTGWNDHLEEITQLVDKNQSSLVHASNFSLGVNLYFEFSKKLAALMVNYPEYQVGLTEIHHTEKKDSPSGTAITIAEGIMESYPYNEWKLGVENDENLAIHALREAGVKGTHIVTYKNAIDTIEFKHEAHSRDGFALGALLAAEWIADKKGIFTMKDVLGLA